jgi:hypothetical protein
MVAVPAAVTPERAEAQVPDSTVSGSTDISRIPQVCPGGGGSVSIGGSLLFGDGPYQYNTAWNTNERQTYAAIFLPAGTTQLSGTLNFSRNGGLTDWYFKVAGLSQGPMESIAEVGSIYDPNGPTSGWSGSVTVSHSGWYRFQVGVGTLWYDPPNSPAWSVSVTGSGGTCPGPTDTQRTQLCNEGASKLGDGSGVAADPVSTLSGQQLWSVSDLSVPTRGGQLEVRRCYNGLAAGSDGPLGRGWFSSLTSRLQLDAPSSGEVTVWQPGGAPVVFSPAPN